MSQQNESEEAKKDGAREDVRGRSIGLGLIFGTALGVVFGVSSGNMGLMAIGISLGLVFGAALGTMQQKKLDDRESSE